MAIEVEIVIHVEQHEPSSLGFSWWADAEQVPGFYAAGDTLTELRERFTAALHELGYAVIREQLAPVRDHTTPGGPSQLEDGVLETIYAT